MCNKKKFLLFCTKTKSIDKKEENQMSLRNKEKFQEFLKQEILIHANIEIFICIFLEFESTFEQTTWLACN
jgi:DNA repair protein RadC